MSQIKQPEPYKEGFFLRRPVLSTVLSIVITLIGVIAIQNLAVEQYPNLVPPVVQVIAQYPGASPEVIAESVATPLEERINGVDDMIYMSSVSSVSGVLILNVSFEIGTDPDIATINVNNRVQAAMANLPDVVRQYGVNVTKSSPSILQVVALTSNSPLYDEVYLSNYALINVVDELKRLQGVGDAAIIGAKDYAIRIWLNLDRMNQLQLSTGDIRQAVLDQNAQYAAGTIGALPAASDLEMTWQINSKGRLVTPEEFGNIILRTDSEGGVLRLKDVARVELAAASYEFTATYNGMTAMPISINLASGANALDTAARVEATMKKVAESFPEGVEYQVAYDTTTFVRISIEEVVKTLGEAMLLVFLVVYLFLQNWRATLIPCLAVPISIIGTFAGMLAFGFSINTLTLFGLVLAIGIVVDDAIVVLENVERILQSEDVTPRQATAKAMSEVTAPVIAIVLVLCSVFIPVSFMGGLAGEMYRQFAITIAVSVTLSGIVALTLTPALCVLLLRKSHSKPFFFFRWFNTFFDAVTNGFTASVKTLIRSSLLSLGIVLVIVLMAYKLFMVVPTSLVPDEDQGVLLTMVMLPSGTALTQTIEVIDRVQEKLQAMPEVEKVMAMAGYDILNSTVGSNSGVYFVSLKSWAERAEMGISLEQTMGKIYALGFSEPKAMILPFSPPPIMGMSTTGGFEMILQTTKSDPKELSDMTRKFIAEASKRPELTGVNSGFSVNAPRLFVDLDREKARVLNVNVSDVFNTLGATLGATYINDFNKEGRAFRVYMQADAASRSLPEDMRNIYVRSQSGDMVPVVSLVSVTIDGGPQTIQHFNAYMASTITGNPASGYSSGQALQAMAEVAEEILPAGYSIAWTGSSYQEVKTGGTDFGVLGLSMLLVFLILAAQYERWTLPLAVLTAVPFAIFGAILANWIVGLDNDVYTQVAMITLLGLACKNAILIVEFAVELYSNGMDLMDSAVEAARMRFRPIIMTSLAFILGCVPLAISSSAGAASREAIGVSVIGGMLAATILAPLLVPYFYYKVMRISEIFGAKKNKAPSSDVSSTGKEEIL